MKIIKYSSQGLGKEEVDLLLLNQSLCDLYLLNEQMCSFFYFVDIVKIV